MILFWYFVLSVLTVFSIVIMNPLPVTTIRNRTQRRILTAILVAMVLPAYLAMILIVAFGNALDEISPSVAWVSFNRDLSDFIEGVRVAWK